MASSRLTGTNENVSTYDSSGGQDYTSVATWEIATDNDLVTNEESEVLECYSGYHTDDIKPSGATTNATYFRIVRPATGEEHSGIPKTDGSCAAFKGTVTQPFYIDESFCQIQDLVLYSGLAGNNNITRVSAADGAVVGCLIGMGITPTGNHRGNWSNEDCFFINCFMDVNSTGIRYQPSTAKTNYVYNCTLISSDDTTIIADSPGATIAKNCIEDSYDTLRTANITRTTCTSDAVTFVDSGNDDYHLSSSDTEARGNGTDLSSDSDYAFDDDIDGDTRSAWDIGFDEYVSTIPQPSIDDQINITEISTLALNLGGVSVSEGLDLSESLIPGVPVNAERFDTITILEYLELLKSIAPEKFENITINEFVSLLKDLNFSLFENVTINEIIDAALVGEMQISQFDTLTLSEFVAILKTIGVDLSQNITIADAVTAALNLKGIEKDDLINISEAITIFIALTGINVNENIGIAETIQSFLSLSGIVVDEQLTLSEYADLIVTSDFAITGKYENIDITEAIDLLFSFLNVSSAQSIELSENVISFLSVSGVDVSQKIDLTEYINLLIGAGIISQSDSINISESIIALIEQAGANVYDTFNVSEFIEAILTVSGVNVGESISVAEYVYVTLIVATGLMSITFSVSKPYLNFSSRRT